MKKQKLKWFLIAMALLAFALPASAQLHRSANNCVEPGVVHFHWRQVGVRPVDRPIITDDDLVDFLAPRGSAGQQRAFDKPWQLIAKAAWNLTDQDLNTMWLAAEQGNFTKILVKPCTVLVDMIFDQPPRPLGMQIMGDWDDRQSKAAWVWQASDSIKLYFFEGCANPAYQVVIPTPVSEPLSPPPPQAPPQPEPVAPPPQAPPPVVCQQCPPPVVVSCPAVDIETSASWGQRLFGGLPELALSAGIGAGVAGVASSDSERLRAGYQSAAYSAGANRLVNLINPDHNQASITVGGQTVRLKKGDKVNNIPNIPDVRAEWVNETIRVYQGQALCVSAKPKSTFNLTPIPVIKRVIESPLPPVEKAPFTPPPNIDRPAEKAPFTPPPNTSRP